MNDREVVWLERVESNLFTSVEEYSDIVNLHEGDQMVVFRRTSRRPFVSV